MATSHKLYVAVYMVLHIIQTVKLLPVITSLRANDSDNHPSIVQPLRNPESRDWPGVQQRLQPPIQNLGQGNVHTGEQKVPILKAESPDSDKQGALRKTSSQLRPPVKPNMIPASEIKNTTNGKLENVHTTPSIEGTSLKIQKDTSPESGLEPLVGNVQNQGSKVVTGGFKKLTASDNEDLSGHKRVASQTNSLNQPKANQDQMIQPSIEEGGPHISNTESLLKTSPLSDGNNVGMHKTNITSNNGKALKTASELHNRTNQSAIVLAELTKSNNSLKIEPRKSIPNQDPSIPEASKASVASEPQTSERTVERGLSPLGKAMKAKASKQPAESVQDLGSLGDDDADSDPTKNKNSNTGLSGPNPFALPKAAIDSRPLPENEHESVVNQFNVTSIPSEYLLMTICLILVVILLLWKRCWYLICTFCCNRRKHYSGNDSGRYRVAYKPL